MCKPQFEFHPKNANLSRWQASLVGAFSVVLITIPPLRAQEAVTSKQHAVLVGVEDYLHPKLRMPVPLKYAVDDVTVLAAALKQSGYEVTLLTDDTGKQNKALIPTKANIDAALKDTLRKCGAKDTILLAFSGHGLQFTGQPDAYFCPMDARPFSDETDTLVSITGIYRERDKSFAGVKVILIDACRNDPDPSRGRGLDADAAPAPPKGVAALFSCSAGQRAFEHDELQHGVFFHHVLEAFAGQAANERREVTFDSLSAHVRSSVPDTLDRLLPDREQSPNVKADLVGRPPVLATIRNLRALKLDAARLTASPVVPFDATSALRAQRDWAARFGQPVVRTNSVDMNLSLIPPGDVAPNELPPPPSDVSMQEAFEYFSERLSSAFCRTIDLRPEAREEEESFGLTKHLGVVVERGPVTLKGSWHSPDPNKPIGEHLFEIPIGFRIDGQRVILSKSGNVRVRPAQGTPYSIPRQRLLVQMLEPQTVESTSGVAIVDAIGFASGIWFGQTEVTQHQWQTVMETQPWTTYPGVPAGESIPAVMLTRDEALEFCRRLTERELKNGEIPAGWQYSLPTSEQWIYACRDGTASEFSFGAPEELGKYAWCEEDTGPAPVGLKRASGWGLYDMHGNVWEWCQLQTGLESPSADAAVCRGGSWVAEASECASRSMQELAATERQDDVGFRIVLRQALSGSQ